MKNAKKKIALAILSLLIVVSMVAVLAACSKNSSSSSSYQTSGTVVDTVEKDDMAFSDGDTDTVEYDGADATITLSGTTGTISDTTRGTSGSTVEITSKGTYLVTGAASNVQIVVNDTTKSGNVYLVLDGVTMTNNATACIFVKSADKVVIYTVGANTITSTASSEYVDSDGNSIDGAIYAKDDVTFNGDKDSTLVISSKLHGIVCKDDLKVTGGNVTVTATKKGIDANDSVRVGGGTLSVTAGHDGIQLGNDAGDSYFYMEDGTLTVVAGYDGIDVNGASGYAKLVGGAINITAPAKGSNASKNSSTSQKGLKCEGDINIGDVILTISSADDAIHSGATISITDGTLTLSSSDDGIHADSTLAISGGDVTISKSYEALEAYIIQVSDGIISVTASDDGFNAAGDTSDSDTRLNPWSSYSSSSGTLTISGGTVIVNCQGDGLDSNGALTVSGGTVYVFGPSNGGNSAIDSDTGSTITGGTVVAICCEAMDSVSFSQPVVSVSLSSLTSGSTLSIDGIASCSLPKSYSSATVMISAPNMKSGTTYTITYGSKSSAATATTGSVGGNMGGGSMGGGGRR